MSRSRAEKASKVLTASYFSVEAAVHDPLSPTPKRPAQDGYGEGGDDHRELRVAAGCGDEGPLQHRDAAHVHQRVLGLDLRRHPLSAHREALGSLGVVPARGLRELPHGARAAGVLETLQAPPTRSGALVHFLLTEDASGLLQSTIFERLFRESGHILYQTGAYLLDGRVEQDPGRGFSFVVDRIEDLNGALERVRSRSGARTRPRKARKAG